MPADFAVPSAPAEAKGEHKKSLRAASGQVRTLTTVANPESRFLNRELSWLAFNERVLAEARDERNPLLERLKYAAICGSNLDEFFMVRVAGVHRQIAAGVQTPSPDGLLPRETLKLVREQTHAMLREIERAARQVLHELRGQGVRLGTVADLGKRERAGLREHYLAQIQPVLTPLIVDPSHPFPYMSNLSLNLGVLLGTKKGEDPDFARVKVPVGVLPRVVAVGEHLLLLEDVIAEHIGELFKGRKVPVHPRVPRDPQHRLRVRGRRSRGPARHHRGRAAPSPLRVGGAAGDGGRHAAGNARTAAGQAAPSTLPTSSCSKGRSAPPT